MLVCSTWGRKTVSQQPPLATLPLLWHKAECQIIAFKRELTALRGDRQVSF